MGYVCTRSVFVGAWASLLFSEATLAQGVLQVLGREDPHQPV
jgi:hypothetical protein